MTPELNLGKRIKIKLVGVEGGYGSPRHIKGQRGMTGSLIERRENKLVCWQAETRIHAKMPFRIWEQLSW